MKCCENEKCNALTNLTKHHLVPKRYRFVNKSRGEVVVNAVRVIILCEICHRIVHKLKTNKELANEFNTPEKVIGLLAEHFNKIKTEQLEIILN